MNEGLRQLATLGNLPGRQDRGRLILDVLEHGHRRPPPLDERGVLVVENPVPFGQRAAANIHALQVFPGRVAVGKPTGNQRDAAGFVEVDVPALMCRLTFGLTDGQRAFVVVGVRPSGIGFGPFSGQLGVGGLTPGIVEPGNDLFEGFSKLRERDSLLCQMADSFSRFSVRLGSGRSNR